MTNTDILRLIEKHSLIGGEIFNQLNTIQLNKDLLLLLEQCNVSGQSEQLPQVNDLMEQIEAECEVYHTEDGEKFKGTSWAQLSKIFEKYGYAPPLPF